MSSHSMYLTLYLVIFLKGSGGWVQNYVVLGAGRNGRIVDGPVDCDGGEGRRFNCV